MQKTASGIILPQTATSTPLPEAKVIAVGPGAPNREGVVVPTAVKAGDRVLLPGWGGNSIKVGEEVSCRSLGCSREGVRVCNEVAYTGICRSTSSLKTRTFSPRFKSERNRLLFALPWRVKQRESENISMEMQ